MPKPPIPPGQAKKKMGITTGASPGVQVNSAAKDSALSATVLASQTTAGSNQVIVPNGITTNNEGNLMTSPVYTSRLITIRVNSTGADTVVVNSGGTGYVVDEIITDNGAGATAARRARFIVTSVSGGVVDGIKLHEAGDAGTPAITVGADRGEYSVEGTLTARATTASASGTGLTVDLTFAQAQETRYITADASNTLTVSDDWIDGPATSENWRISYIIQDAATVNGLGLINKRTDDFNSTRRLQITKGVETNDGWLFFVNGVSLETVGNGSVTTGDIDVAGRFDIGYMTGHGQKEPDGTLGTPTSGAALFFAGGAGTADGNLVLDSGSDASFNSGRIHFFNVYCKAVNNYRWDIQTAAAFVDVHAVKCIDNSNWHLGSDIKVIRGMIFEGDVAGATSNQDVRFDGDVLDLDGAIFTKTDGLPSLTADDPDLRNTEWLDDNTTYTTHDSSAKTYFFTNVIWNPDKTTQGDINFASTTLGTVTERYQIDVNLSTPAGVPISGATAKVIEKTLNNNIPHDGVTDALGFFTADIVKEEITPNGASGLTRTIRDDFSLHVNNYGDSPFFSSLPVAAGVSPADRFGFDNRFISIAADAAITQAVQATAITAGSGILVEHQLSLPYDAQTVNFTLGLVVTGGTSGATGTILQDTDAGGTGTLILQGVTGFFEDDEALTDSGSGAAVVNSATGGTNLSHKAIAYDAGTGSVPTIGETITVANAGADTTGEVRDFAGDAVSGILLLENWNGVAPDNNVLATGGTSTFSADTDTTGGGSSVDEEFFWYIDADTKSMTATYDYLAARMAEDTLLLNFEDVHLWGHLEHAAIMFSGTAGFFTNRNVADTQGVWIGNRGGGTTDFFTSDDGTEVTLPVQVNLTFTGLRDNTEVRVYTAGTTTELAGVENATDGSSDNRSVTFSLAASISVDIRFAHGIAADGNVYRVPDRNSILAFTWPTVTSSLPITQVLDRNFDDPV